MCRLLGLGLAALSANAMAFSYDLKAVELNDGCYLVEGSTGYFNNVNGGNIVNTGFIVSDDGVLVIDTGPSKRYGEELRRLIDSVSGGKPIRRAVITHMHPDHYLGNLAFGDIPIAASAGVIKDIKATGEDFTLNMYRLVGDWMRGTEPVAPDQVLEEGMFSLGSHTIRVAHLSGHTGNDTVVFDETCGVLYTGDLVFNRRTLATPHADLERWRQSLDMLRSFQFSYIAPGHGAVTTDVEPIDQTVDYLAWLERALMQAYDQGLDITEVMELPIPDRFSKFALARDEYRRSVANLFPGIEARLLPVVNE